MGQKWRVFGQSKTTPRARSEVRSGLMTIRFLLASSLLAAALFSAAQERPAPTPDAVVAADGSGQYRSLQEAISSAPMRTGKGDPRFVIFVKKGVYRERVYVQRERGNMLILGEEAATTIVTYDLHANIAGPDGKPIGTFRTPTVQVDGDDMIWENLTIANGAGEPGSRPNGPPVAQALALRVDGDRVVFKRCRFLGFQDTILLNRGRHYFADSYIEGHVDFIFGAATAYFDHVHIHALRNGYITAASTPEGTPHGFVFREARITGNPGVKTYLGRPWRNYARTVFIRTEMSSVVHPEGWHNWNKPEAEKTVFYAEFGSTGEGSAPSSRVPWARKLTPQEAEEFTPEKVLGGADAWLPAAPPARAVRPWSNAYLRHEAPWYTSAEARSVASSVIQYQSAEGGWPKSTDLATPPRSPGEVPKAGDGVANTIDNDATTLPLQFLARVAEATGDEAFRSSFLRGIDYLLASQYPNGGFPQFYPLRGNEYYSRITYNDGAMIRALQVLRDVAAGQAPYTFVDAERRTKAADAVKRGLDCILKTQIVEASKLTVWCAQHDEKTLAPAWARAYEPPSFSGSESVGIVNFLMAIDKPTPEIIAAIEGAMAWFGKAAMTGVRVDEVRGPDGRTERQLVPDPTAPRLWARFYELGTSRPLYLDRDSVFRYNFAEIGYERRSGYAYHGTWAERLLTRDYPAWRARHASAGRE